MRTGQTIKINALGDERATVSDTKEHKLEFPIQRARTLQTRTLYSPIDRQHVDSREHVAFGI